MTGYTRESVADSWGTQDTCTMPSDVSTPGDTQTYSRMIIVGTGDTQFVQSYNWAQILYPDLRPTLTYI